MRKSKLAIVSFVLAVIPIAIPTLWILSRLIGPIGVPFIDESKPF